MKAIVFSIGEPTTELSVWALRRHNIETELIENKTSLADKLAALFAEADEDILRVDADIIVNRNILDFIKQAQAHPSLWLQSKTFDWFKQDISIGTPSYIKKELIPTLRQYSFKHHERPETEYTRIKELHNPRRFASLDILVGLHGFGQADINRVKQTKARRGQLDNYDFELAEKLCE